MKMIELPKGVTVHVAGQKYGGDKFIPAAICPKRFAKTTPAPKPSTKKSDDAGGAES